jgi:hypothetical protein
MPIAGVLFVTLLAAVPVAAGEASWQAELERIDQSLAAADWEGARESAHRLAEGVVGESDQPRENRGVLARASAYEAIAEAGLGLDKAAQWHWYVAQNLDPEVRRIDLSRYGAAGESLERHHLLPAEKQHPLTDVYDPEGDPGGFRHPQRTAVVYPRRPQALSEKERFSHAVFVQVTVDERGGLSQPLVMDAAYYPGLVYNAFEALREWSFQPATVGGEPVTFRFVLPVVFSDDRPEQSAVFFVP